MTSFTIRYITCTLDGMHRRGRRPHYTIVGAEDRRLDRVGKKAETQGTCLPAFQNFQSSRGDRKADAKAQERDPRAMAWWQAPGSVVARRGLDSTRKPELT